MRASLSYTGLVFAGRASGRSSSGKWMTKTLRYVSSFFCHHVTLAGVGPVAARIDRHHVDAGFALDDPFGELPTGTAGRGDAEAVAFVEP